MAEEKEFRSASRYDAVIATLVGLLALCVSGALAAIIAALEYDPKPKEVTSDKMKRSEKGD